jgi:hypothetical protein
MTRNKQKEKELEVLNYLKRKIKKYKYYNFTSSEQPDFIDINNKVGIEITDFHNSEISRIVEEQINKAIFKTKILYQEVYREPICVYLHFNFNFLKSLEKNKSHYLSNEFSNDLFCQCERMMVTHKYRVTTREIRKNFLELSKTLNRIGIISDFEKQSIWQMVRASNADIDDGDIESVIKKKEKKLQDYKINNPQIETFVLLIKTGRSPIIGLKRTDYLYSTSGPLKHKNNIKHIKSEFDEVYLVNLENNLIIRNCDNNAF